MSFDKDNNIMKDKKQVTTLHIICFSFITTVLLMANYRNVEAGSRLDVLHNITVDANSTQQTAPKEESEDVSRLWQPLEPIDLTPFTEEHVCRATISIANGRDVSIMSSEESSYYFIVSYTRKDDNTFWRYKCKIEGDTVTWGSVTGRWMIEETLIVSIDTEGEKLVLKDPRRDKRRPGITYKLADF